MEAVLNTNSILVMPSSSVLSSTSIGNKYFHLLIRQVCERLTIIVIFVGFMLFAECHAMSAIKSFPEDAVIQYGENKTPTHIKGKNLSSNLDHDPDFVALKKNGLYTEIAYKFLESRKNFLKIDSPRLEFERIREDIDELQFKHVRFQQVINGIPIWGHELTVHLNKDNQIYLVNGYYEPTLKNIDITPVFSEQGVIQCAIKAASVEEGGWKAEQAEKYIFMADRQAPRLAYRITLFRGVAREFYFIDAIDGKVLHRISGTQEFKGK